MIVIEIQLYQILTMKQLVIIGDGMADFPREDCHGTTPLAVAPTPAMDSLASEGLTGLFCPIPEAYPAGSDIGNLSLFGYDPADAFTGRAPLEAANQAIPMGDNDVVFRCNLVTLEDGRMKDFTADHIETELAHELIAEVNSKLGSAGLQFYGGVSYRHLAKVTTDPNNATLLAALKCTPPHDIIGREYETYLPAGVAAEYPRELMIRSQELLNGHPLNQAREASGKLPATSIWLWGQGTAPRLTTYRERFGIDGAVISAVDLVNGIGRCAGFEVLRVPGATGYLDTNYEGKVAAAIDALSRVDFVYLHIEAPDEASHEGRLDHKLRAIEDLDRRVVGPCLEFARSAGNVRILVAPDHITALETRTHAQGPVPFILWGPGVRSNGLTRYSEAEAAKAGVLFPAGHDLVPAMIEREVIDFSAA